jgi:hypothetical protein
MKKLDVNTVGMIWTLGILLVVVGTLFILEKTFALVIILIIVAMAVFYGVPYLITYLWNRFIADE